MINAKTKSENKINLILLTFDYFKCFKAGQNASLPTLAKVNYPAESLISRCRTWLNGYKHGGKYAGFWTLKLQKKPRILGVVKK